MLSGLHLRTDRTEDWIEMWEAGKAWQVATLKGEAYLCSRAAGATQPWALVVRVYRLRDRGPDVC